MSPQLAPHVLYHFKYSICSIMVRYTIAVRGPPADSESNLPIVEQDVDIFNEENITEHYLCEVNPKGQVPALTSTSLPKPIADSLDITLYLTKFYPSLMPQSHQEPITRLLAELHALNYFSLSFAGKNVVAQGLQKGTENKLKGDISDKYREALKYKLGIFARDKLGGIKPGVPEEMNEKARALLSELESLLPPQSTTTTVGTTGPQWLFGLPQPTALDAHLVVFIGRMRDVGRLEIIPEALRSYADRAMATEEWEQVMQGRQTMISKATVGKTPIGN